MDADDILLKPTGRKKAKAMTAMNMLPVQGRASIVDDIAQPRTRRNSEPADYEVKRHRETSLSEHTVEPELLAQMHAFAEEVKQKRDSRRLASVYCGCSHKADEVVRNAQAFQTTWGRDGSWLVTPFVKRDMREKPHSIRPIKCLPNEPGVESTRLEEWGVAYINTKGCKRKGDYVVGQDGFSIARLPSGWEVICVMDGHGPNGDWPANRGCETMPFILSSESCTTMLKHGQVEAALHYAFSETEKDLEQRAPIDSVDIFCCGSTATVALRNPVEHPKKVWVATVGDSRAMLFSRDGGVLQETTDHKPTLPAENERLIKMGCDVKSIEHGNGFVETRVYVKDCDYPGLCMSRCLGDCIVKEVGVTWEPVVEEWDVLPGSTLILASDGVWEFFEAKDVIEMVLPFRSDNHGACEEVVRQSRAAWCKSEGFYYCDDITMVHWPMDLGCAPVTNISETSQNAEQGGCTSCAIS